MSTRLQIVTAATGTIAAGGLCLVLAGPASAASGTPSTPPPSPISSTATPAPYALMPSSAASDPSIAVPAGNAGVPHDSSGASITEISLLFGGGLALAAGGTVLARRRT